MDYVVVGLVTAAVVLFVVWFCTHNREDAGERPEVLGGLSKEEALGVEANKTVGGQGPISEEEVRFLGTDYVIARPDALAGLGPHGYLNGSVDVHARYLTPEDKCLTGILKAINDRFPMPLTVTHFIDDDFKPLPALVSLAREFGFSVVNTIPRVEENTFQVYIDLTLGPLRDTDDLARPAVFDGFETVTVSIFTGLVSSSWAHSSVLDTLVENTWLRFQHIQDRALAMCDIKSRTETVLVENVVDASVGERLKAWNSFEEYRDSFGISSQDTDVSYRTVFDSRSRPGELFCVEAREFPLWEYNDGAFNRGALNKSRSIHCGDYRNLIAIPATVRQKENMVDNRSIHAFLMSERRRLFQRNERAVQQISAFLSQRNGMGFKAKFFRTDAEPVEHDENAVVDMVLKTLPYHHAQTNKVPMGDYPFIQIMDVGMNDDALIVDFISNYVALGTVQLTPAPLPEL